MVFAITRAISPSLAMCELTHLARQPIDVELANQQHRVYETTLIQLGCRLLRLPAEPELPDSVFVEDAAIVFDEIAIITRPGAVSRRLETPGIARALLPYRQMAEIEAPGTLDGGDVLCIGKDVFIGLSSRSNAQAIQHVQEILSPFGYRVHSIRVEGFLHLKSAATLLAKDLLLVNSTWVDPALFGRMEIVEVDPGEPYGANALWIGRGVIYPSSFPRTQERIETALAKLGMRLYGVDVSELQKAEGAVTCCSLIFRA